jgi:hypothetical protein
MTYLKQRKKVDRLMTNSLKRYDAGCAFIDAPLYVTIPVAAKIAGCGEKEMREYANRSHDPIPHKLSGRKIAIEVAGIKLWMRKYIQRGAQLDYPDCEPMNCPCVVRSYMQGFEAACEMKELPY